MQKFKELNEDFNLSLIQIKKAVEDDNLILFVGAGVSANSNLPNWGELINSFSTELKTAGNDIEQEDYLKVAQYYYNIFGKNRYLAKIDEIFADESKAIPNELHEYIAKINPSHIITTNFDTLLEKQFSKSISKYNVISKDIDIPYAQSEKYLIKMHGDLKTKNIVLKEDDYLDYQMNFPMMSTLIQSLMLNHTVLFIGYSLKDSTFNSIFRLVQKNLSGDAKKAYFYTPMEYSQIEKDYYKKRGIYILSNIKRGSKKETKKNILFSNSLDFLKELAKSTVKEVSTEDDVWRNVKFLDKLEMIDPGTLHRYSELKRKAIIFNLQWSEISSDKKIKIKKGSNLYNLLKDKTLLESAFETKLTSNRTLSKNKYIEEAYDYYEKKEYRIAKLKFRELANEAFKNKDYFNYLICEFNFNNILGFERDKKDYAAPVIDNSLSEITEQLIDSTGGEEKKLLVYFRDVILNYNFLYYKLESVNDYFNSIRKERELLKKKGSSWNSYLGNAEFEIKNLNAFIKYNCICVNHFKLYQEIINRYAEILLISYANSKLEYKENSASSIIKELEVEDIKIIMQFFDVKLLKFYLGNMQSKKLKISKNAVEYIYSIIEKSISKYSRDIQDDELEICLKILPFIEIEDYKKLVRVMGKLLSIDCFSSDVDRLFLILLINFEKIEENTLNKLIQVAPRYLSNMVDARNLEKENHYYFSRLMKKIRFKDLYIMSLDNCLYHIMKKRINKIEVFNYTDFLINWWDCLDVDLQNKIKAVYATVTQDEFKVKVRDVVRIMGDRIYDFSNLQKYIYKYFIQDINETKRKSGIITRSVVNPLACLYWLENANYYSKTQILKDITTNIRGKMPEIDWDWFESRDYDVIKRLIENQGIKSVKNNFCKTNTDENIIGEFLINELSEQKIKFVD